MIRRSIAGFVVLGMVISAGAHPVRTLLVEERKLPAAGATEVGLLGWYEDVDFKFGGVTFDIEEITILAPYVRYGVTDTFAVQLAIPYVQRSPEGFSSQKGLGDIQLGAELVVYEDIFRYPWIKPYVNVSLSTGDEDKGLGSGNTDLSFGVAIGTQMYDYLGFVLDGRYDVLQDDNIFSIGGSVVWDLSKQFALLAEFRSYEETDFGSSGLRLGGGMIYWPTPSWMVGVYGGTYSNGVDSTYGAVKVSFLVP